MWDKVTTEEASVYICQIIYDLFCTHWYKVPVGGAGAGKLQLQWILPEKKRKELRGEGVAVVGVGGWGGWVCRLAPLCHTVSEGPMTRLSRSDMMRSDGSFLQNSSLPLIHPYHRQKPPSYCTPLTALCILELTSRANRAVLIKDHLASVQISLIECQSGMFACRRGGKWAVVLRAAAANTPGLCSTFMRH